jgi:hypothetical protein
MTIEVDPQQGSSTASDLKMAHFIEHSTACFWKNAALTASCRVNCTSIKSDTFVVTPFPLPAITASSLLLIVEISRQLLTTPCEAFCLSMLQSDGPRRTWTMHGYCLVEIVLVCLNFCSPHDNIKDLRGRVTYGQGYFEPSDS